MRIFTNTLTARDLNDARLASCTWIERETEHKSRTHERSFDVILSGNSRRRPNRAHDSDEYAATWDQWGVFLAVLFDRDPDMIVGSVKRPFYAHADDFDHKTDWRFEKTVHYVTPSGAHMGVTFWPSDSRPDHPDHRFRYDHRTGRHACTDDKCSAMMGSRW